MSGFTPAETAAVMRDQISEADLRGYLAHAMPNFCCPGCQANTLDVFVSDRTSTVGQVHVNFVFGEFAPAVLLNCLTCGLLHHLYWYPIRAWLDSRGAASDA